MSLISALLMFVLDFLAAAEYPRIRRIFAATEIRRRNYGRRKLRRICKIREPS